MRWRDLLSLQTGTPLPPDFFETPRRAHFLGIGGIGMSALALLLKARGHRVSGSDERDGAMPQKLRESGVEVFLGHEATNVAGAEAIFYSSAIPHDNPEWIAGHQAAIPFYHRAQLLAHVSNRAKVSIAVSGTHGKSTTSAMIAHILTECGCNPTAILGAIYPPFGSNLRIGDPDLVVVEADESDGSFTLLHPTVAVILNVEPEHLENYDESEDELWRAFAMFGQGARGRVLNADQAELTARFEHDGLGFGLSDGASVQAKNVRYSEGKVEFDIHEVAPTSLPISSATKEFSWPRRLRAQTFLRVPGTHNVLNGLAAVAALDGCALEIETKGVMSTYPPDYAAPPGLYELAPQALQTFAGTLRRFERKGEAKNIVVYDDYGHHPTEVRATLEAAFYFLQRPLVVIFQPHRYSRTQALWRDFGTAFEAADTVIITQLYSAHETPLAGVSGRLVYDAVRENNPGKPVFYAENLDEALALALGNVKSGDAVLTMGAGDVTSLGARILEGLEALPSP